MASRRAIWVLLAVVLAGGVLAYVGLANGGFLVGSGAGSPVIIPAGYVIQLQPGSYVFFQSTFANAVRVAGSFSTSYSVALYVMTPTQFGAFSSGARGLQYVAAFNADRGQTSPTNVALDLQQGRYYFVVVNPYPFPSSFETADGIISSY